MATAVPHSITVPALAAAPALVHGFSTRTGGLSRCYRPGLPPGCGDLNLGFTKDDDATNVQGNRLRFLQSIGAERFQHFGLLRQTHSTIVHTINTLDEAATDFTQPAQIPGDALITDLPGVLLTVQVADCIPVLLYDEHRRAIAAIHAGWRGTAARIVEHTIAAMHSRYGTHPAGITAAIGPGIGPESYSVGQELFDAFQGNFPYAEDLFTQRNGQLFLDLWQANARQLQEAGVEQENIHSLQQDTAANTETFFSHRAEHGQTGRMMAAIGLTNS